MPAAPRPLALITSATLAVLALAAPAAAPAAGVRAPDGLRPTPDRAAAASPRHGARPGPARRRSPRRAARLVARAPQAPAGDPRAADQWSLQGDAPMGIDSAWRQT